MKIQLDGILENNYLKDEYGKYAAQEFKKQGVPYINFPFSVVELDNRYKYISWVFIDHDAYEVCAFSWVHWLGANYNIIENKGLVYEGLVHKDIQYTKGRNSYASPLGQVEDEDVIYNYGGPQPPNKDHDYTLIVYAHEHKLDVDQKYNYNDFIKALKKQDYIKKEVDILSRV